MKQLRNLTEIVVKNRSDVHAKCKEGGELCYDTGIENVDAHIVLGVFNIVERIGDHVDSEFLFMKKILRSVRISDLVKKARGREESKKKTKNHKTHALVVLRHSFFNGDIRRTNENVYKYHGIIPTSFSHVEIFDGSDHLEGPFVDFTLALSRRSRCGSESALKYWRKIKTSRALGKAKHTSRESVENIIMNEKILCEKPTSSGFQ